MKWKLLAAAAGLAAAVALLVGIWSNLRPHPKAPPKVSQADPNAALQEKLNALGTRMLMLEANQAVARSSTTEHREAQPAPVEKPQQILSQALPFPGQVSPEVVAAEAKTFNDFYATLDQKRLAEAPDRAWATTVQRSAVAAMNQDPPVPGTSIGKVECGATLCRVETTHESEVARRVYMTLFPARMGDELQHGSIFAPVGELRTVGYFGRKGFPMPDVPQPEGAHDGEGSDEVARE